MDHSSSNSHGNGNGATASTATNNEASTSELIDALRNELLARDESIFDLQLSLQTVEAEKVQALQDMQAQSQQQIRHLQEQLRRATHEANLARQRNNHQNQHHRQQPHQQPQPNSSRDPPPVPRSIDVPPSEGEPANAAAVLGSRAAVTPGHLPAQSSWPSMDRPIGFSPKGSASATATAAALLPNEQSAGTPTGTTMKIERPSSNLASSDASAAQSGGTALARKILELITVVPEDLTKTTTTTGPPPPPPPPTIVQGLLRSMHTSTTEADVVLYVMNQLLRLRLSPSKPTTENPPIDAPPPPLQTTTTPPAVPAGGPPDTEQLPSTGCLEHTSITLWRLMCYSVAMCSPPTRRSILQTIRGSITLASSPPPLRRRRTCVRTVTRRSTTSTEGNINGAGNGSGTVEWRPSNAFAPEPRTPVSLGWETGAGEHFLTLVCHTATQWRNPTSGMLACHVLWMFLDEDPDWRPTLQDVDWIWDFLWPQWSQAASWLIHQHKPKAHRRMLGGSDATTNSATAASNDSTIPVEPKSCSFDQRDVVGWLTTSLRFFTLRANGGTAKSEPERTASEGSTTRMNTASPDAIPTPVLYRHVLAVVLDVLEHVVLPRLPTPRNSKGDTASGSDRHRDTVLHLAAECLHYLNFLAHLDPPCPTAKSGSGGPTTGTSSSSNARGGLQPLALLRVQMPTTGTTATVWDLAPPAVAVAVGLFHIVACNLEERDVYQAFTEPRLFDVRLVHSVVRFFHQILHRVQLKRRLPDTPLTAAGKNGASSSSALSFLQVLSESLHLYATATALLLHSTAHLYQPNPTAEEAEVRQMLRTQMEELSADEDELEQLWTA